MADDPAVFTDEERLELEDWDCARSGPYWMFEQDPDAPSWLNALRARLFRYHRFRAGFCRAPARASAMAAGRKDE
jgi:hypothetical protein